LVPLRSSKKDVGFGVRTQKCVFVRNNRPARRGVDNIRSKRGFALLLQAPPLVSLHSLQ
jgi:hypothetical protein